MKKTEDGKPEEDLVKKGNELLLHQLDIILIIPVVQLKEEVGAIDHRFRGREGLVVDH